MSATDWTVHEEEVGGRPNGAEPRKKYNFLTIFDFLDRPAPKALITGVLPASGEVNLLFGESNAYKSFLALDMLSSVAHGLTWHGYAVDPGPVVYVVTEGAYAAVTKRYRGWLEDHNIPREDWGKVKIIDVPVPLNLPGDVEALIATLAEDLIGAKFVVFDLQQGSMEGSDGDGEVAGAWVKGSQRLSKETGVTQLHVTHTGWSDTKRSRGHSHLWGSFSTRLKAEGNNEQRTTRLIVERHKDEDDADLAWSFTLEKVPVGDGPDDTLVPRMASGGDAGGAKKSKGRPRDEKREWTAGRFLEAYNQEAENIKGEDRRGFIGDVVQKVLRKKIITHMKTRGWLDLDDKGQISSKGRTDFKRARDDLERDGIITEQNEWIWRIDQGRQP